MKIAIFLGVLVVILAHDLPTKARHSALALQLTCPTFPATLANGDVAGLADAIECANDEVAFPGAQTINLAAGGTYTLTAVVPGATEGPTGLPAITVMNGTGTSAIVINGNGATITRSGAAPAFRIFFVDSDGDLTLNSVTVSNGLLNGTFALSHGGGIHSQGGTLTLNASAVLSSSVFGQGGGIFNGINGTATIVNGSSIGQAGAGNNSSAGGGIFNSVAATITIDASRVSGNSAINSGAGGGINNEGVMTITNSTIGGSGAGNSAVGRGGGIANIDAGTNLTITNTTVSFNTADAGGGLGNSGIAMIVSSNISNNSANHGGGMHQAIGEITLDASTVSSNTAVRDGGGISQNNLGNLVIRNGSVIGGSGAGNQADRGGGIFVGSANLVTVDDSDVSYNTAALGGGVFLSTFGRIIVRDSRLLYNVASTQGGAISQNADAANALDIEASCIVGNSNTAVDHTRFQSQNATGNWWGAADGPSGVGPGSGDSVSANVDFSGFLTAPILGCPTLGVPEIDVFLGATPIADENATPVAFSSTPGVPVAHTFTVQNNGTANLVLIPPISVPTEMTVTASFGATTLIPGGSTTFTVQCDASSLGAFFGYISFANNDANENTYDIYFECLIAGGPEPEIGVLVGATPVTDNVGSVTFGSTVVLTPVARTFTVQNTGTADLDLTPPIDVPLGFSVSSSFAATTVTPANSTTFSVQCDAASVGIYSGTLSFANNDSNENPYNFTITCVVTATPEPEIEVASNITPIPNGGSIAFGTTSPGNLLARTFTVENAGSADLTLVEPITVPAGFTVTASFGSTTVTPGNNTTFSVQCDAAAEGSYSGLLSFGNNDSDENPYEFTVSCEVITLSLEPEIEVLAGATPIPNGGAILYAPALTGTPVALTFTVQNLSIVNLTLVEPINVPAGFTVTASFGSTTVTPGNNTTFSVQCDAAAEGIYSGLLSFGNNDSDENPYQFTLQCNVSDEPAPSEPPGIPGLHVPNIGELMISQGQAQQPFDRAGGEPIYLSSGAPLMLPHDWDGNGFDTYTITEYRVVDGVEWYAIFVGNQLWLWVPETNVTLLWLNR